MKKIFIIDDYKFTIDTNYSKITKESIVNDKEQGLEINIVEPRLLKITADRIYLITGKHNLIEMNMNLCVVNKTTIKKMDENSDLFNYRLFHHNNNIILTDIVDNKIHFLNDSLDILYSINISNISWIKTDDISDIAMDIKRGYFYLSSCRTNEIYKLNLQFILKGIQNCDTLNCKLKQPTEMIFVNDSLYVIFSSENKVARFDQNMNTLRVFTDSDLSDSDKPLLYPNDLQIDGRIVMFKNSRGSLIVTDTYLNYIKSIDIDSIPTSYTLYKNNMVTYKKNDEVNIYNEKFNDITSLLGGNKND